MDSITIKDLSTERWLHGISPEDRTSDVALRTSQGRLGVALYLLRLAAEKSGEDIEQVHQLRV